MTRTSKTINSPIYHYFHQETYNRFIFELSPRRRMKKLGLWIRIRIHFSSWIRIRIQCADPDPGG